ncbi:MAG: LPS assembly lipoprotein LptE [Steroidobacteraceae bacterium]
MPRPAARPMVATAPWFVAWSVAGLALLALAGCGFHLQRPAALPASLESLRIETEDPQSEFYHALRQQLQDAGADTDGGAADAATLRILRDGTAERVLSVSARNVPTEYELSYSVRLVVSAGGRELLPVEEFTLTRDYSFDETALLAKQHEREALSAALARDLASVVMRRLASVE